jgi:RNA polymerase sigma-70 factor (ECF subfamily)
MATEQEIYEAFSENRERGWRLLMDTFQVPLYNYIRRMVVVHADAEDVLQNVLLRALGGMSRFRRKSSLATWLYAIATNECTRFLNKRKGAPATSEEVQSQLLAKLQDTEYVDYDNALAVTFQQALLRLPEKQRIVFDLRYYEGLEYAQISSITGSRVETLKVDYHYAKEKIRNYIKNS